MKRSATLIVAWLALVCLLGWSGRGRADDPNCSSCDCAEDIAWALTGDTKSYVLTVYDDSKPAVIGAAATTARWKNMPGQKNMVYHTTCVDDKHVSGDILHRVLVYNKSWSPICKLTGTQTDTGYIATKYDAKETLYSYPDKDQQLQPRIRCAKGVGGVPE